jgi:hypothetical protein
MESYLVRIYTRDPAAGYGPAGIVIDIAGDRRYTFRNLAELNAILQRSGGRAPHKVHHTDTVGRFENYHTEQGK